MDNVRVSVLKCQTLIEKKNSGRGGLKKCACPKKFHVGLSYFIALYISASPHFINNKIMTFSVKAQVHEKRVQNMTMNFGPQHPAAHGVLRLVLTLDGEVCTLK